MEKEAEPQRVRKKVEVGWEREKDTQRDRVGERVKDR